MPGLFGTRPARPIPLPLSRLGLFYAICRIVRTLLHLNQFAAMVSRRVGCLVRPLLSLLRALLVSWHIQEDDTVKRDRAMMHLQKRAALILRLQPQGFNGEGLNRHRRP